ncbi:TRAP transporter, DctM subunit [Oscillibacter sp. PC13]|uniref:TRAP transporter large permease n=1 Tax=Oscillibacter sp. PC13 TaxID=1855299 RepID=UPI0008EC25E1|nr:TRAP transporter large permease [Oscillibacter sp. PC13]SFP61894.1 TRAP transporter, DctM subunit [Oscillibacter sp. PC13]
MSPMWGLLLLLVLFLIGLPVAFSLGVSAVFIMFCSGGIKWATISGQMVAGINSFTILAVPLFLLTGNLMNKCGVTDRLFKFAKSLVGWMPGGLGHVNVLASFIFAGMSGTAIADASGLGRIEIKAMEDAGYDKDFSCAVTAASSTLGPIIPPSMPLVVYGTISGASVGALFIAGVIPGVIMALLMMLLVFAVAKRRNYPREKFLSGREFLHACKEGFLPCLTPVIILLGIYTGLFTPTESAAIAVVYAAFLGLFVYKEITVRELGEVIKQTISDSVGLCALVATSNLFGTSLVKARIPQIIMSSVMGDIDNEIVFMLIVVGILLLVGMFMETVSAIAILTPIIVPIATSLGVSLVHLGVVVVLTLMIGVLSPPFGVVLFAVNRVGEIPMGRLIRALIPWFVILLVGLLIVALVPQTCTWLPALANLGV